MSRLYALIKEGEKAIREYLKENFPDNDIRVTRFQLCDIRYFERPGKHCEFSILPQYDEEGQLIEVYFPTTEYYANGPISAEGIEALMSFPAEADCLGFEFTSWYDIPNKKCLSFDIDFFRNGEMSVRTGLETKIRDHQKFLEILGINIEEVETNISLALNKVQREGRWRTNTPMPTPYALALASVFVSSQYNCNEIKMSKTEGYTPEMFRNAIFYNSSPYTDKRKGWHNIIQTHICRNPVTEEDLLCIEQNIDKAIGTKELDAVYAVSSIDASIDGAEEESFRIPKNDIKIQIANN